MLPLQFGGAGGTDGCGRQCLECADWLEFPWWKTRASLIAFGVLRLVVVMALDVEMS